LDVSHSVADRFYAAFNARDFDTWGGLLDDDVELMLGSRSLRGRDAALEWAAGLVRADPGVVAHGPGAGVPCEITRLRGDRIASLRSVSDAIEDAGARGELERIADEQAALRRVAELVARGESRTAILDAVALEAWRLLGGHFTALLAYEPDGPAVVVAMHGAEAVSHVMHVGMRLAGDGDGLVQRVRRSARTERVDSYTDVPGSNAATARDLGLICGVGAPIVMEGQVWGALTVLSSRQLPPTVETRLGLFAELVATAIANAQARSALQALADEQSALRHVAELVAHATAPQDVFAAVAREASALLGGQAVTLTRFSGDRALVVVATHRGPAPVGTEIAFEADTLPDWIRSQGRVVRVDDYRRERDAALAARFGLAASVAAPIVVAGEVWGMLTVTSDADPLPAGTETRIQQFAELVAAALANAENKAKLTASRARVVATADETRRRLQRDVHDAAQQRLVHTIITLKLARDEIAAGGDAAELVTEALAIAERADRELRDVVRGILPASLTRGGLRTGLESLAMDLPIPVELRVTGPRLPAQIETTAYFVVAEALTNVVKHAEARHATVEVAVEDGRLAIDVRDDGVGDADPERGTGLTGLLDRIEASAGTLSISSPPGRGTTLRATLPLD
jgi:signal transduction histidine kinase